MSKKLQTYIFLSFLFSFSFFTISEGNAQVSSKLKIMVKTSIYGTIGGALLGTASLAYGTSGRAIPIGASLGLYAGLLFGGYILATQNQKDPLYDDMGIYDDERLGFIENHLKDVDKKSTPQLAHSSAFYLDFLKLEF